MKSSKTERFEILDSLRGLAALAVCLFHFAGRDDFLPGTWLQATSRHGYLGVVAFFVISGFVIPWSLYRSGYRLGDFPRFLLKRLLRLEPPYLVAVASVVGFIGLYSALKEQPFPPSEDFWLQVTLHLGYLTRLAGFDWLDDLYWTLAVEFQFYLMIGLIFPLLHSQRPGVRWTTCGVLTALGYSALALPQKTFVITCLPVFVLGILAYQYRTGLIRRPHYVAAVTVAGAVCYSISGIAVTLTAMATTIVITGIRRGWTPLNQLGTISYSLYLFHATIGNAVVNFGIKHFTSPAARYLVLLAALGAGFALALAMYWIVERPAQRWSKAVRYKRSRDRADEIIPPMPASAARTSQRQGSTFNERPAALL